MREDIGISNVLDVKRAPRRDESVPKKKDSESSEGEGVLFRRIIHSPLISASVIVTSSMVSLLGEAIQLAS
ncbi:hypothetical protein A2U01_0057901 [Trifolium medium]|uniref:Uncharacterized protein n=1 Tax=Trifolium medium TaxID=97028 RepID=A0A392RJB4_9FABA|nr:hypothetical protein [Trifolium medium]